MSMEKKNNPSKSADSPWHKDMPKPVGKDIRFQTPPPPKKKE